MAGKNAGRSGSRYRALIAETRQRYQTCWHDGQPINMGLHWPDPGSWSLEHVQPLSTHPELAEDPGNLRASHLKCNQSAGNREPRPPIGMVSRKW